MFVSATLVGPVVTKPDIRYTTRGVPVANFAISTHPEKATEDTMTTWVIAAYASLADEVMANIAEGDSVIVTGTFSASDPFTSADGITRTRIECRAQSVAPALGASVAPAVFALRGTVATVPDLYWEGDGSPGPVDATVELDVRTSRFKRGDAAQEADVTFWPVTAYGDMAVAMADWQVGDSVVVVGEARPLTEVAPDTPQVEILATSAGVDLYPQEAHPAAKLARPGRAERKAGR